MSGPPDHTRATRSLGERTTTRSTPQPSEQPASEPHDRPPSRRLRHRGVCARELARFDISAHHRFGGGLRLGGTVDIPRHLRHRGTGASGPRHRRPPSDHRLRTAPTSARRPAARSSVPAPPPPCRRRKCKPHDRHPRPTSATVVGLRMGGAVETSPRDLSHRGASASGPHDRRPPSYHGLRSRPRPPSQPAGRSSTRPRSTLPSSKGQPTIDITDPDSAAMSGCGRTARSTVSVRPPTSVQFPPTCAPTDRALIDPRTPRRRGRTRVGRTIVRSRTASATNPAGPALRGEVEGCTGSPVPYNRRAAPRQPP